MSVRDRDLGWSERLVLETARIPPPSPEPNLVSFTLHGEYQLRYRAMNDLRLTAPPGRPDLGSLGQSQYVYHWLRLSPRFQYKDVVAIVGQIDVPRGMVLGDTTTLVDRTRDPLNEPGLGEIHPRYLYIEYTPSFGVFRIGQQGSHWGMGVLANDGEHPSLFGDYGRGSLTERVLFATSPMGKDGPLSIALAGDLVLEDNTADLLDDHDRALQAVAAVVWRTPRTELGLYGVIRSQMRESEAVSALTPLAEEMLVGVADVSGKLNGPLPGGGGYVYGSLEAAAVFGSTTYARSAYGPSVDPAASREPEAIRSFGAAATVGAVRVKGRGQARFGDLVAELGWGYASGDADPNDGVNRRFTFDPNFNVGLVLFDHVLAWKTARAATLAQDPELTKRPAPGVQFLPSRGGVFGAAFLNPRVVVRPRRWLDLKAGVLIAQATADVVDPYHAGALGEIASYDGGDERSHDLGLELDLGIDARLPVQESLTINLGAEGGVLFPGHAFDDALGRGLGTQTLVNVKVGVNY